MYLLSERCDCCVCLFLSEFAVRVLLMQYTAIHIECLNTHARRGSCHTRKRRQTGVEYCVGGDPDSTFCSLQQVRLGPSTLFCFLAIFLLCFLSGLVCHSWAWAAETLLIDTCVCCILHRSITKSKINSLPKVPVAITSWTFLQNQLKLMSEANSKLDKSGVGCAAVVV